VYRSALGAVVGGCGAFLCGFVAGFLNSEGVGREGVFVGAIMAGGGATAGAIVGAIGDLSALLRQALPALTPPEAEADYGDVTPPSAGPDHGSTQS
jgi:hypothetical protein